MIIIVNGKKLNKIYPKNIWMYLATQCLIEDAI